MARKKEDSREDLWGSYRSDAETNARIKVYLERQRNPIFKPDANLDEIALFMQREYDPKQVHTAGAYRLALKELARVGINVPSHSRLNRKALENLYIRIESRVKAELKRKLSGLER